MIIIQKNCDEGNEHTYHNISHSLKTITCSKYKRHSVCLCVTVCVCVCLCVCVCEREREREKERKIDRETETDRQRETVHSETCHALLHI